jgi:hypothetical protein
MRPELSRVPDLPQSRPLEWADRAWLAPWLAAEPPGVSEMTFTNLLTWSDTHPVRLARLGDTLLFWRGPHERGGVLPPLGAPLDAVGVRRALEWAAGEGGPARFFRVPEATARTLVAADGALAARAERDHADYVYRREELATLAGRHYDGKRNLIKKFYKAADAVFQPLDSALAAECLRLQSEWCADRGCSENPDLDAEDHAVVRTLELWNELPLRGGALLVGGPARRIAGFAVAERLTADTAVIHFEKGSTLYPGVYQALNQLVCERLLADFEFVNREQDLGVEGLRKAKLSYRPVLLLEKFEVKAAGDAGPEISPKE